MIPVTREHRQRAFACVWMDQPSRLEREWIETGEHEGSAGPRLVRTAQAFADFEAEILERKKS